MMSFSGKLWGIAAGVMAAMPAAAQDYTTWEFYGQLNLGALSVDNGASRDNFIGENSNMPSRVGFWYRGPNNDGAQLSFNLELGFGMTGSGAFSAQNDDVRIDLSRRSIRKFEFVLDTPAAGRLSIGQGSMAADGSAGTDLSGTGVAHQVAVADIGGGTEFLRLDGSGSGTTVDDGFSALDGARRFRIRYDSPRLGGFQASAAYGQEVLRSGDDNDYYDVALSYLADAGDYTFEGKLTYEWVDSIEENLVFSAALLHNPTGLNAAFATGRQKAGDGKYAYVKLGVIRDVFCMGSTAVSVDYYDGTDIAFAGADSKAVSFGIVQEIDRWNMNLFLAHRAFELSSRSDDFRNVNATLLGARWRF